MTPFEDYILELERHVGRIVTNTLGQKNDTMVKGIIGAMWDKKRVNRDDIIHVVSAWGVSEENSRRIADEIYSFLG